MPQSDAVWLLACILAGEAGVLSTPAMLAVGHVAMNRLADSQFPDAMIQVLQEGFYGRREPSDYHLYLARRVLRREHDPTGGMLYCLSEQDRLQLGLPEGELVYGEGRVKIHLYREWPDGDLTCRHNGLYSR